MLTLVVGCQKPSNSVDTNQSQQADADSKVIHPSDAEFNNLIAGGKPVLVDFLLPGEAPVKRSRRKLKRSRESTMAGRSSSK
jgi:hypothetical protein